MRFSYFVWDFDGTLFDTYDAIANGFFRATKQFGIDIPYAELRWMTKHSLGWTANELEKRFGVPAAEMQAAYFAYSVEEETIDKIRPYPGVDALLKAICDRGGRNYLYSHRNHVSIDALEHYNLKDYFSDFITKDHHFPRKPAPDALLYLIGKHSLNPDDGVMIGDRALDVEAGINAGMQGILFDPEHFCKEEVPACYRCDSLSDLLQELIK